LELSARLAPAVAPDELWNRIEARRAAGVERPRKRPVAAMLTTVATVAAALWLVAAFRPALDLERLAAAEVSDSGRLDLVSNDAAEINAWLRKNAGVEAAVPLKPGVQLCGARVVTRNGARIGEVAYRIGSEKAALLVAHAKPPEGRHGQLSWTSRGQIYALACSNRMDPGVACRLCHLNAMSVN
jgi:hypothetical protein